MGKNPSSCLINLTSSDHSHFTFNNLLNKPIEIYVFIDPLCPKCWSLEPYLKKLIVEYGCYFKMRPVATGKLCSISDRPNKNSEKLAKSWERIANRTGMSCDGDYWLENPPSSSWQASLAIKAAELQGQRIGAKFLRKLQEYVFLGKQNISDKKVLMNIAKEVKLDRDEFKKDLDSNVAKKALQGDLNLAYEMDVDTTPTVVLFNKEDEEDGLKVSGLHNYSVYVKALLEIMKKEARPCVKPSLEEFLSHFSFVATKEVAVVYDWTEEQAAKELKKLLLSGRIKKVPVKHGDFWEFIQ